MPGSRFHSAYTGGRRALSCTRPFSFFGNAGAFRRVAVTFICTANATNKKYIERDRDQNVEGLDQTFFNSEGLGLTLSN